ncbi:hypothetical protein HUU59_11025 [bacterium]|nr:hypothetical protein [bacterium]
MARPRRNGIDRFNVAIDIHDNPKFTLFKRTLGLSEGLAYLHLVRFIQYVAANHAFEPVIDPESAEIIADYCYYQGPGTTLLQALQKSGFLTSEWEVKDWFIHQPLAELIHNKRVAGAKGGQKTAESHQPTKDESGKFTGSKPAETTNVLPVLDNSDGTQLQNITSELDYNLPSKASDARTRARPPSLNGTWKPPPEIELLAKDLIKASGIGDKQDRKDIAWDVFHVVQSGNEQDVHTLISELRQGEHSNAENLTAVIRARLKKFINTDRAPAQT